MIPYFEKNNKKIVQKKSKSNTSKSEIKIAVIKHILTHKNTASQIITGYTNHWWNGVTCHQLAKVIEGCIKTKDFWKGTRHLHSPEPINKANLLQLIIDIYEWDIEVDPIEVEGVDRTLSSSYGFCDRQNIPPIEEQLKELREVGYE